MGYKINFFARPIDSKYNLPWESLLIELSLGIICAVMAVYGWNTGMALMAYPAAVVSILCFGLVTYSLFTFVRDRISAK